MAKLYVVGTPIGNLQDITARALKTLQTVDFIAAEDTRVTMKLLNHFEIKKHMISYFEHNRFEKGEMICDRIAAGESCALVTDAGMPAISDPGEDLVRLCRERGIAVEVVPGPTAFASAIAVSGLKTGRFTFEGFLSVNKKNRKAHLGEIKTETRTMIFYEAPHKLLYTLKDMKEALGERNIVIARELTKIHEEVLSLSFSAAIEKYTETPPKGEIVLILEGAPEQEPDEITMEDAVAMARVLMEEGVPKTEAAKTIAHKTGYKKGDLYKELI